MKGKSDLERFEVAEHRWGHDSPCILESPPPSCMDGADSSRQQGSRSPIRAPGNRMVVAVCLETVVEF